MTQIILNNIDISAIIQAHQALAGAIPLAKSDLEKAGAIQYFEFCYELAWKTMRKVLMARGKLEVNSPKVAIREAGLEGLIDDTDFWFETVHKRNLTTHTYHQELADEVFNHLPKFEKKLQQFIATLKTLK